MKATVITVSIFLLIQFTKSKNVFDSPLRDYHMKIGIPMATKIQEWEHSMNNYDRDPQRIVGGAETDITEVPYQVGLLIAVDDLLTSLCGGSLISQNSIVTAAHCCRDGNTTVETVIAVLGSNTLFRGGLRVLANEVIVHPRYDDDVRNDIAVVKIPAVTFTDRYQPIALPTIEQIDRFTGLSAIASGYGLPADGANVTIAQSLFSVEVEILSNEVCAAIYGPFITRGVICTNGVGGRGPCRGDSGGPLAVVRGDKNILVGITSFGSVECESGFPTAFTRVSSYIQWIQSVADV